MDFLDYLRAAITSPVGAFHEFKLNYKPNVIEVHAFFESDEDVIFYCGFIRQIATSSFHAYKCGSKSQVYDVYQLIRNHYPPIDYLLFFVDKDLSDILEETYPQDKSIYVSGYYSIENYLVDSVVIKDFWARHFLFNNVSHDFDIIGSRFDQTLYKFHASLTIITAWYIGMKLMGYAPNFKNIRLNELFSVDQTFQVLRKINSEKLLNYLDRACGVKTPIKSWKIIRRMYKQLRHHQPKTYIKGKFEIWFFVEFTNKLKTFLAGEVQKQGGSVRETNNLSTKNAVSLLRPSLYTAPNELQTFLNNIPPIP